MSNEADRSELTRSEPPSGDLKALQMEAAEQLNQAFERVLPWTLAGGNEGEILQRHCQKDRTEIVRFLDSAHLFKITEVSVADDRIEEAVARSISKRHQALVTAAYQSDLTLATVLVGRGGGSVSVFLGVSGPEGARKIFLHQLQGIYPGKGVHHGLASVGEADLHEDLSEKKFGGIITGIPPTLLNGERQTFDLTTAIRSMHGERFVMMAVARPVPKAAAAQQIMELMETKDRCHSLVKQTVGRSSQVGVNQERGVAEARTTGGGGNSSTTHGQNVSGFGSAAGTAGMNLSGSVSYTVGITLPWTSLVTFTGTVGGMLAGTLTLGGGLGLNRAKTDGESTSESLTMTSSESNGWSRSIGESLQIEQQSSLAMELEHIADKLIKRLRIGLNSGIWELFFTFATDNELAARILSGAVCGELLKSDPDALPSRNLVAELPDGLPLFLPESIDPGQILTGNPLVSHVASEEAALLLSPPLKSVPGFDVRVKPALSLTDTTTDKTVGVLGSICEMGREVAGSRFSVSNADIKKHIFVAGITGSGKTTTVKQLLAKSDVPFLVLESAKREYRRLLRDPQFKGKVQVYTIGDSNLAPLRHNPFVVIPGVSLLTHIDNLKSIFNASFSLYGPMPYLLEQALHNIYRKKGWNLTTGRHHRIILTTIEDCRVHWYAFPTIRDLTWEVAEVVDSAGYEGELRGNIRSAIIARLDSLAVGAKGFVFNTHDCCDIGEILRSQVVFELESLADDDDKAFFVGLMLTLVSEYRQVVARQPGSSHHEGLKHILVIEEAHRLLKNIVTERSSEMLGNPRGKAVESFCNLIAEMRSLGQGVIVAEQIPTKIAPDVLKNTNTKIIHRLVSADDQRAVGTSLGLHESDSHYLNQLETGFALVHKEGMARPIEVRIAATVADEPVDDNLVKERSVASRGGRARRSLEEQLLLHESGLLDLPCLPSVTRQMINSIILSGKELNEVLPAATARVRHFCSHDYLSNDTIEMAVETWFNKILLSPSLDLGDGKSPTSEVIEGLDRFWHEQREFTRDRLVREMEKWARIAPTERILKFAATAVAAEIASLKVAADPSEFIERELLLKDPTVSLAIRSELGLPI
jgi:hypothetical protein